MTRNFAMPPIALAIATTLCAACAPTGSSPCPPLVEYSHERSERLADEIAAMDEGAVTPGIVADYFVLRRQVRACREAWP